MSGILYGTGTGPGEAELLTLKAVRLIRSCDMIAVPVSDSTLKEPCIWEEGMPYLDNCTAYQIVLPEVPEIRKKPVLCLPMPMMKEKEELKRIHDAGAKKVEEYLDFEYLESVISPDCSLNHLNIPHWANALAQRTAIACFIGVKRAVCDQESIE